MRKSMTRGPVTCICTSLLLAATVVAGGEHDWPQWRGPNHDGKATQTGVLAFNEEQGLKVTWQKDLGSAYSSVSIADGVAVTMFSDHQHDFLVGLAEATGNEVWRYQIDTTYVGHDGSHDGTLSSPTINDGKVFALAPKGQLLAISLDNGKLLWKTHLIDDHQAVIPRYGFTSSPLVIGDLLIVQGSAGEDGTGNMVLGFDKTSGKRMWVAGNDIVNYQSPIPATFHGREQVVCAGNNVVLGLEPTTGEILWQHRHEGNFDSYNPVLAGDNQLYLRHANREGMLLRIVAKDGVMAAEEVWRSRQLRGTFNVAVYHDKHLYGYAGRYIACVNAENGELVWKSRSPGDGFMIYADGHLVVQTKAGTMHVIEASPAGYNEVANLQVFADDLVWTPPSFANGRIYTRSLARIAALEVARTSESITIAEEETTPADSLIGRLVKKVAAATDKKATIDQFLAAQSSLPIIENDRMVHFVYRGPAQDMAIRGDMIPADQEDTMYQIEGTDFYYRTYPLVPDAHICYQLIRDFDNRITDPSSANNMVTFFGEESTFGMPEWQAPAHLQDPGGKPRGRVERFELTSEILMTEGDEDGGEEDGTRIIEVYLPAGYDESEQRYPTIYFNYGQNAIESGRIPFTLDNLIADQEIVPVIAVFIHAPNSVQEYARALRDEYARHVVEEVIPFVDSKLRTIAEPTSRAFAGGDEGGFSAIYTTFKHPGTFSMVAGQSTHLYQADGDTLKELVQSSEERSLRFYLDWGTYDLRYAGQDVVWQDYNRDFAKHVKQLGYDLVTYEVNEGFGWCSWRNRTDRILKTFFTP
jgi:enterochelin esterase-like enzyme/outer membrane protein assembly factor BamB